MLLEEDINVLRERREKDRAHNEKLIVAQRGGQQRMLSSKADITIGGGSRGGSKPLEVHTRVVTPFGYREIGDLKEGDIITGLDGGMQRVIYKVNQGMLPCYKLKFVDGSEVIASYDHAWNVRQTCYRSKKRIMTGAELKDDWRVWTTKMIVDRIDKRKSGEKKNGHLVIPVCQPVKFTISSKDYGIDPYLLGVILGDGCIVDSIVKHDNVMFTTEDKEIVQSFIDAGYNAHSRTSYKSIDYIFKSPEFVDALKKWKLYGHKADEKFVPRVFKFGTVEERFAILQGLMDTDGTIDKRGHCSFTTTSRRLAEDVKFLVNSLGGLATISEGESFYTQNGERKQGKNAFHVYIRIERSDRLFRLERKKCLSTKYNGGISEYTRRIVDYEYVGERECCCIRVSNTDSLFLVEDFIVTHNSFSLLMKAGEYLYNSHFRGIIFRKGLSDLDDLSDKSMQLFPDFGTFRVSKDNMGWAFNNGGSLRFSYHDGDFQTFDDRFRGKEFSYIGIDEVTQMPYRKFKMIASCNRNAFNLPNRIFATCNPDPDSWVRKFIDWWIGDDGYPVPERDGIVRYCYMRSDTDPTDIVWGDTRQEVFEKCHNEIMRYWQPGFARYGKPEELFITSVTFIEAKLADNIELMQSSPDYIKQLSGRGEEMAERDLGGNWNYKSSGTDLVKFEHMERFFDNAEQTGDSIKRVSCDAALDGGDQCTMWLWTGNHISDVFFCKVDGKTLVNNISSMLERWGVREENFTYDLNGVGKYLQGFFPKATPFNNKEAVQDKFKGIFFNVKAQAFQYLADAIIGREISIDPALLERRISGKGYKNATLRDRLMVERKVIAFREDDPTRLIDKSQMKRRIGGNASPDLVEGLAMRFIFEIKGVRHKPKNLGLITGASNRQQKVNGFFARRTIINNGWW